MKVITEAALIFLIVLATLLLASSAHAGRGACCITDEQGFKIDCLDDYPDGSHISRQECEQTLPFEYEGGAAGSYWPEQYCEDAAVAEACPSRVVPTLPLPVMLFLGVILAIGGLGVWHWRS
jgi:hypothetical protein